MNTGIHYCGEKSHDSTNRCVICGSKSIGMNFGVLTCAPCKGISLSSHLFSLSYLFFFVSK